MDKNCHVVGAVPLKSTPRKHGKYARRNICSVSFSNHARLHNVTHLRETMFATFIAAMFYSSAIAYGRIRVLLIIFGHSRIGM